MYPKATVGSFARVRGGKRLPNGHDLSTEPTAHPYIRARDIRAGTVAFEEPVFLQEETFDKISRYTVRTNDVCVTIVGANVGDVGRVPPWLDLANLTENAAKITDLQNADARFLTFALLDDRAQRQMKQFAGGAAQPKLALYKIEGVEVFFPPYPTQQCIADILCAYDDLIENNTKRIKILEEMARSLYREWFVNFRFPGHEKTKFINSKLGKIPDGWAGKRLDEVAAVNARSIKRGEEPEFVDYVDIASVSPGVIEKSDRFSFADAPGRARRLVQAGDTIWSTVRPNRRSYAFLASPPSTMVASTGFAVLSPRSIPPSFLYYSVTTDEFVAYIMNRTRGAAYPACTGGDFEGAPILVADDRMMNRFDTLAGPILEETDLLHRRNANLRATRDLLLPRLISGELDVSSLRLDSAASWAQPCRR